MMRGSALLVLVGSALFASAPAAAGTNPPSYPPRSPIPTCYNSTNGNWRVVSPFGPGASCRPPAPWDTVNVPPGGWSTQACTTGGLFACRHHEMFFYLSSAGSGGGGVGPTGATGPKGATGATGPRGPQGEGCSDEERDHRRSLRRARARMRGLVKYSRSGSGNHGGGGHHGDDDDDDDEGCGRGPTGATGPRGATGPQGPAGMAGAKGDKGEAGPAGATGPKGDGFNFRGDYVVGNSYATGDVVFSGGSSYVATQATSDIPGTTSSWALFAAGGATGPSGANGTAGATGATGPSGASGTAGASGAPGPSGASGGDGATGATGPSGVNGSSGPSGASGPSEAFAASIETAGMGTTCSTPVTAGGFGPSGATGAVLEIVLAPGSYLITAKARAQYSPMGNEDGSCKPGPVHLTCVLEQTACADAPTRSTAGTTCETTTLDTAETMAVVDLDVAPNNVATLPLQAAVDLPAETTIGVHCSNDSGGQAVVQGGKIQALQVATIHPP